MRKVLVVTYYWPPAGGSGVQRVVKFCKYLSRWGWEPVVLTVENGNYPVLDESLLGEVTAMHRVHRARSLEPHGLFRSLTKRPGKGGEERPGGGSMQGHTGLRRFGEYVRLNLFIPDSRIGWLLHAGRKAREILESERPAAIISTSPPYTPHLVAMKLKQRYELPWVADFRDPWLENHTYNTVPRLGIVKEINRRMETRVLREADRVICANQGILDFAAAKLPPEAAAKFTVITHGYDSDDLRPSVRSLPRFTISHFGTIYPDGFPAALLEALRELSGSLAGFREDFLLRIRGSVPPQVVSLIGEFIPEENLDRGPYIPHGELLAMLFEGQVLVFVVNDFPGNHATVPGKLYEYLPTGNPILGIGPSQGDAAGILSQTGAGRMFEGADKTGIKEFLSKRYRRWRDGTMNTGPTAFREFERKHLAGRLADELNALVPQSRLQD